MPLKITVEVIGSDPEQDELNSQETIANSMIWIGEQYDWELLELSDRATYMVYCRDVVDYKSLKDDADKPTDVNDNLRDI